MTLHPPPTSSRYASGGLAFPQYVRNNLGEVASGSRRHDHSDNRDRMAVRSIARDRLHRKSRAAEAVSLNARVGEEPVQQDFLNCEGLEKRWVLFFGHVDYRTSHNAMKRVPVPSENIARLPRCGGNNRQSVSHGARQFSHQLNRIQSNNLSSGQHIQYSPDHPRNDQSECYPSINAEVIVAVHSTITPSLLSAVTTGDPTTEYAA